MLDRLDNRPTWLLARANARAHRLLTDALAEHGVRGYHYRVLAALDQHGPGSQADLGRHTGIDRSDVVATLDDLIAADLAVREPDPADRRRNIIDVTPAGTRKLLELDIVLNAVQEAVLAPLTPAERRAVLRILAKLR